MFEFIRPQAYKIYFDRKVEYCNLIEQNKKNKEDKEMLMMKKKARDEDQFLSDYQLRQTELI
jgi:hypothetical protein